MNVMGEIVCMIAQFLFIVLDHYEMNSNRLLRNGRTGVHGAIVWIVDQKISGSEVDYVKLKIKLLIWVCVVGVLRLKSKPVTSVPK